MLEDGRVVGAVSCGLIALILVVGCGAGGGGSLCVGLLLVTDGVEPCHLLDDLLVQLLNVVRADELGAVLLERCEPVTDVDERLEDGQLLVRNDGHARHDARSSCCAGESGDGGGRVMTSAAGSERERYVRGGVTGRTIGDATSVNLSGGHSW